jgi:hypothetical protein
MVQKWAMLQMSAMVGVKCWLKNVVVGWEEKNL